MADLSSIFQTGGGGNTQLDELVQSYKASRQSEVNQLNQKKSELETRKKFFNNLNSKFNSLIAQLDKFQADGANEDFVTRKAASSNTDVLTASGNSEAALGSNQITVNRLASSDILISDRVNLDDAFGEAAGTKSFDISVNGNTTTVNATFDGSETNEEALNKIVAAVNNADDTGVSAAFIKDTADTGRLTFNASESGTTNAITFTDTDGVLANVGLNASLFSDPNNRTVVGDTTAGYQRADSAQLNASLNINGINVVRDSNTIDDLLSGVTLNLHKAQESGDQPVSLTTDIDTEAVKSLIDEFINKYNDLLSFLQSNKNQQRQDPSVSSLYTNVRRVVSQEVTGLEDGVPSYLMSAGIEVGSDGKLSITDTDQLEELLKDDPGQVANLFTSADGFAAKLESAIQSFTGEDGLIKSRTKSLSEQIDRTVEKKEKLQERIDSKAEALREEYERVLKVYLEAESQYQTLLDYSGGGGSSGGGLF